MKTQLGALLLLLASIAVGCGGAKEGFQRGIEEGLGKQEEEVTESDFGDRWPLTVSRGILKCEKLEDSELNVQAVTFEAEGKVYAVNGIAKGRKAGEDIDPIWAENPSIPGTKKDISPLIDRGRSLCN